jgi:acyl carrier protein phosphodiesterase
VNYLGHCLLSFDDEKLLVGNFLGDFTKRKEYDLMPHAIQKGVDLHRFIDDYTDSHQSFKGARALLSKYGHYSAVMVDLYFDHFLAREWNKHHSSNLRIYADWVYKTLEAYENELTEKAKYVLPHLRENDWIVAYADTDGFESVLRGMDRRSGYKSGMGFSYSDFLKVEEEMRLLFHTFINDVKRAVTQR